MEDLVSIKVNKAASGLIGFGLLTIFGHLAFIFLDIVYVVYLFLDDELELETLLFDHLYLIGSVFGLIAGYVIFKGGRALYDQERAGWIYAGALVAMMPCCSGLPFCCLGLPLGFWVLALMQDELVRTVFDE